MSNGKVEWKVVNPAAEFEVTVSSSAPRLSTLSDKKIGLFSNGKPGVNVVLDSVMRLLQERYENMEFEKFSLFLKRLSDNVILEGAKRLKNP